MLILTLCGPLSANPGIEYSQTTHIVQHITWSEGSDVLQYKLIIEKNNNGVFTEVINQNTTQPAADISLPPGEYRYRVVVYDLLGRERPNSQWSKLTVLQALKPEIDSWTPDIFYTNDLGPFTIELSGKNMQPDSSFFLLNTAGESIEITKTNVNDSGKKAQITIAKAGLQEGVLKFYVENPGGLKSEECMVIITFREKTPTRKILNFSQGWGPIIPVKSNFSGYFNKEWYPLGASLRLSILPFQKSFSHFGIEIEPVWAYLSSTHYDSLNKSWEVSAHFIGSQVYILYQNSIFFKSLLLNVRLGGGFLGYADLRLFLQDRATVNPFSGATLNAGGGIALKFFVLENFFVDAGAESFLIFNEFNTVILKPSFMFGWSF
ncbi:MAG: hypothetical protein LBV52_01625 [Spirochaetaceae bacterium]|nr:hypothetical protein [Spirochaetaceae bacterium]